MSVRFQRVGQGTGAQSLVWALEVAKYINEKFPQNPVQVYTERFGDVAKVYWVSDWDNIATLDARQEAIQADEGFVTMIVKAQQDGLFVPGSVQDTVLVSA